MYSTSSETLVNDVICDKQLNKSSAYSVLGSTKVQVNYELDGDQA